MKMDKEAVAKEKDRVISRLRSDLCDANIRYENALILCKERQELIAALKEEQGKINDALGIADLCQIVPLVESLQRELDRARRR